jgi:CheY-like chemotaxis protein
MGAMKILKFLVIEDDDLLREVLCGALREALREREREGVIFEAPDRSEATRIVKQGPHIDLIVLDLELPETDGFEFVRELEAIYALRLEGHAWTRRPFTWLDPTLSWYPTVSLVIVSEQQGYDIFEYVGGKPLPGEDDNLGPHFEFRGVLSRAFDAGAVGFIPKSSPRETIFDAFRRICAGAHYLPPCPTPPVR